MIAIREYQPIVMRQFGDFFARLNVMVVVFNSASSLCWKTENEETRKTT